MLNSRISLLSLRYRKFCCCWSHKFGEKPAMGAFANSKISWKQKWSKATHSLFVSKNLIRNAFSANASLGPVKRKKSYNLKLAAVIAMEKGVKVFWTWIEVTYFSWKKRIIMCWFQGHSRFAQAITLFLKISLH